MLDAIKATSVEFGDRSLRGQRGVRRGTRATDHRGASIVKVWRRAGRRTRTTGRRPVLRPQFCGAERAVADGSSAVTRAEAGVVILAMPHSRWPPGIER